MMTIHAIMIGAMIMTVIMMKLIMPVTVRLMITAIENDVKMLMVVMKTTISTMSMSMTFAVRQQQCDVHNVAVRSK